MIDQQKKKCKLTEDNIKIYLTQQISRFSFCEDYMALKNIKIKND